MHKITFYEELSEVKIVSKVPLHKSVVLSLQIFPGNVFCEIDLQESAGALA
jgi:hypothetical protein